MSNRSSYSSDLIDEINKKINKINTRISNLEKKINNNPDLDVIYRSINIIINEYNKLQYDVSTTRRLSWVSPKSRQITNEIIKRY